MSEMQVTVSLDDRGARLKHWVASSLYDISPHTRITHGQLLRMAKKAFEYMNDNWRSWVTHYGASSNIRGQPPATMSAMLVGSKIYISSSVRAGDKSWIDQFCRACQNDLLVMQALKISGMHDDTTLLHSRRANCGELLAIHLWAQMHHGMSIANLEGALIATCHYDGARALRQIRIKPGCDPGCKQVLTELKFVVVDVERSEPIPHGIAAKNHTSHSITFHA